MQDPEHNWLLGTEGSPAPSAATSRAGSRVDSLGREVFDAVIGPSSYVSGVVHLEGFSRIDGKVDGEVTANGELLIGEKGVVRANISATRVRVLGQVIGDIECEEHLELGRGAEVHGNIKSPSLVIEDGVMFQGFCTMYSEKEPEEEAAGVLRSNEVLELSAPMERDK